jgi:ATP-binding cassette subfamily F protein 3
MLSDANFLILDEPTNHLDITSKEILESAISGYEGTVLYVSHDRYFINKTATRILDLTRKSMVEYIGNYDYYMEHVDQKMNNIFGTTDTGSSSIGSSAASSSANGAAGAFGAAAPGNALSASSGSSGSDDYKAQKEDKARRKKLEAALKKCEETIAKLEERDGEITEALSDPSIGTDLGKLRKLTDEQNEIQEKLSALYDEWEELSSENL